MSTLLEAALSLHDAGLAIVPLRTTGEKVPAVRWAIYQDTRPTREQVEAWFITTDTDGLGAVTGAASGNLEMFELEGRAIGRLPELADLANASGLGDLWARMATGWTESTPSGGIHWHAIIDGPVPGNTKLARRPATPDELAANPTDKIKVLAETRGQGGFTVLAPSAGRSHPTGGSWTRLAGGPETMPTLSLDEREQFCTLLRTLDEQPEPPRPPATPVASHDPTAGITPGDDFENKTDWADILVPHGWTHVSTHGRTRYWRRPGKDHGISATTGHASDRDRLFVFTSSTEFTPEVPYTKLGAIAVLEHDGDMRAAAKEFRRRGFGGDRTADLRVLTGGLSVRATIPATDGATALAVVPTDADHDGDDAEEPVLPPSWQPVDLGPYLDGTWKPAEPTMLARSDGIALMYPGLVHDFHGESESGKSLVVQAECAARIQDGERVLYVDFESDAGSVTARMVAFGCGPDELRDLFVYVRPEASPHAAVEVAAWAELLTERFSLAVLDGVTDALGQFGGATKENDDIAAWHRAVPRTLAARTGAAVALIDHVVKATEGRGRFALGGQAKMAAIDGASYLVEVDKPLGKGLVGVVVLRIGKDRPGSIRPHCGIWRAADRTQEAARITIDSTADDGGIAVTVAAPDNHVGDATGDGEPFRPTGLMERISRLLESMREPVSLSRLGAMLRDDGSKAKSATIAEAVNLLVDGGYLSDSRGPRNARMLRTTTSYRQVTDPESDAYTAPLGGLLPTSSRKNSEEVGATSETTSSHLFPTSSRRGEPTSSRPVPPVGDGEEVGVRETSSPLPAQLFGITDPSTGLQINPATGEVID